MPLGKVVLINFGIMVACMLLASMSMGNGHDAGMGALAFDAFFVLAQVGVNMLIGLILVFTESHKQLGGAMLIAGVIMGVIGFGSCLLHMAIIEG
jgi:hypothetical protein